MVLQDGVAETTILQLKQSLPVEMKMFWGSSSYKMQLKQIFTEWIAKSYKGSRPLFLGGENKDDVRFCVMIADGDVSFQPPLKWDQEEADDPTLFIALMSNNYKYLIIASPDTDIFVNVTHHFSYWMFSDLKEPWLLSPNKASHSSHPCSWLVQELYEEVASVLSLLHAFSGTVLTRICMII